MPIPPRRLLSFVSRDIDATSYIAVHATVARAGLEETPYSLVMSPQARRSLSEKGELTRHLAVATVALHWLGQLAATYAPLRDDNLDGLAKRELRRTLTAKGLANYRRPDPAAVVATPLLKGMRFDRLVHQLELRPSSALIAITDNSAAIYVADDQLNIPPAQAELVLAIATILEDGDYAQLWESALLGEFGQLALSVLNKKTAPAPAPLMQEITP